MSEDDGRLRKFASCGSALFRRICILRALHYNPKV